MSRRPADIDTWRVVVEETGIGSGTVEVGIDELVDDRFNKGDELVVVGIRRYKNCCTSFGCK